MSETVYLTTEQVVTIALDRWSVHVADYGTVDGAVNACQSAFAGYEKYPTVWDKAVCLLRRLASTQGFVDGNKRTAWTACETFLGLNGIYVEPPEVCATVFVLGLTKNEQVEEGRDRLELIEPWLAVEWLQEHQISH